MGPLSRVVTVRGGEYYFTPGINGLRYLAAGYSRQSCGVSNPAPAISSIR